MKKRIVLVSTIIVCIFVSIAVYLILPWAGLYLYGRFKTEEPEKPQITQESFPFTLVYEG